MTFAVDSWEKVTTHGLYPYTRCAESAQDAPPEPQIEKCREWIRAHVVSRDTFNMRPSLFGGSGHSYHLKHVVESWTRRGPGVCDYFYVSNGAFIEAALREGYRARRVRDGSLNAFFNMKMLPQPKTPKPPSKRELLAKIMAEMDAVQPIVISGKQSLPRLPDCGGIYFVQTNAADNGPIKIGQATNISRRIGNIQTSHPWQLRLLAHIPTLSAAERDSSEARLHERFRSFRLHGEWFSPEPELLAFIATDPTIVRPPT